MTYTEAQAKAAELAATFRQLTKSSHRTEEGVPLHLLAAELLEKLAEPIWCGCGDGITPESGAQCGTCAHVARLGHD